MARDTSRRVEQARSALRVGGGKERQHLGDRRGCVHCSQGRYREIRLSPAIRSDQRIADLLATDEQCGFERRGLGQRAGAAGARLRRRLRAIKSVTHGRRLDPGCDLHGHGVDKVARLRIDVNERVAVRLRQPVRRDLRRSGVPIPDERLHLGGFERAALQECQQCGTPDSATSILQQGTQLVGRRDLAQGLPCGVERHRILLRRRHLANLRHEMALARLSDSLYCGKAQAGLGILQRRHDVGGQLIARPVLANAVSRDPDRLDAGVQRQRPPRFGEPLVYAAVGRFHPAQRPQRPGFLRLRQPSAAE